MGGGGGGGLLLIILILATSQGSDYRTVSYEALLPSMDTFEETGVRYFSEIVFDVKRYQMIVGARDALFRLSMDGLKLMEKAEWPATQQTIGLCTAKGQSDALCRNYVKILLLSSNAEQVFACGTHAFSPKCSWREIGEIGKVTRLIDGRAKCPYSPLDNATALMTARGEYFIGSATDFQSTDHAIYRMSGHNVDLHTLRTVQYDSKWLAQPDFVAQFETEEFMYFLFRETAAEVMNCGKAVYSRIARVCKNDQGGTSVLKNQWTTFLKARLNCSQPGEFPFYYNEIQSAAYLPAEGMVYATFTTSQNSIAGTAVCNFNMTAVEAAFDGDFKYQPSAASSWSPARADHQHFQCRKEPDNDDLLVSTKYQLMDNSVASVLPPPLHTENLQRFGQIAVDSVHIKNQDNQPVHVIFVASEDSSIKKLSYNPSTKETCLIEILHPFPAGSRPTVRRMKLLSQSSSPAGLYITTDDAVIRLPVQRCGRFKTSTACLNAMDPYCGWNKQKSECVTAPNKNPNTAQWQQNFFRCPVLTEPVDGGWSDWSDWAQCSFDNPDPRVKSQGDNCRCRARQCDSPAVSNGGLACQGSELMVTNCTQHGGWTLWSPWSGCSQTCGAGLKTRSRHCGNPAPAYGGKVCIGRDVDEQYCDNLPRCDSHTATTLPRQASWSSWTDWTSCSAQCGVGFRSRSRRCYGLDCAGCDTDYERCENSDCSDHSELQDYTPWVNTSQPGSGGGWEQVRFLFTAPASALHNKAGRLTEQRQYCYGPGRCTEIGGREGQRSNFSDWSSCSVQCGGGSQWRVAGCDDGQCVGTSLEERPCNTQPCDGSWSCWSAWAGCEAGSVGTVRTRDRTCSSVTGDTAVCVGGSAHQELPCSSLQSGQEGEERGTPVAAGASVNFIVGGCVLGFILGGLVGAGLVYYYLKIKKNGGLNPPHYISAKSQNLYVSLPLLDLKQHKQLPPSSPTGHSDYNTSTLRSNTGTLRSSKNGSSIYSSKPVDYETATIKRSHSRRDSSLINSSAIRADLDSDNLFT